MTATRDRLAAWSDRLLLAVGCLCHWLVGRLSPLWGRDPDLWLFGAREGRAFEDNAKYLFRYVAAERPDVRAVWLSKDRSVVRRLRDSGYEAHHASSLSGLRCTLRAGVVVFTHGLRDVSLPWSGGARAVLLWHGTPLKRISWDDHFPETPLVERLAHRYAHSVLDLVTAESPAVAETFVSAFGVARERIATTGYPRNDRLTGRAAPEDPDEAAQTVDRLAEEGRVVVYLPTYRSGGSVLDTLDLGALSRTLASLDAHCCLKLHPQDDAGAVAASLPRVHRLPADADVYPVLARADALVTDYSSVYFDFLLRDRPVVFYAPDLETYRAGRGFYYPYEAVTPGPVVQSPDALPGALERALADDPHAAERRALRDRFCLPPEVDRSAAVADAVRRLGPP